MLCHHGLMIYLTYTVYGAIKKNHMKEQNLNKDHLLPAQMVSQITMQVDINAAETVKAKLTFEREEKSQGVMINVYHTDN